MTRFDEHALLRAWERGASQHPVDRALTLLGALRPETSRSELAGLSIGARDAALLGMRERLFGASLRAATPCPSCGEELELAARTDELRAAHAAGATADVVADGASARIRAVDSRDLAAVAGLADAAAARRGLLGRIVLEARRGSDPIAPEDLPEALVARIEGALAELDAQAEVLLDLTCPACANRWRAPFDVGHYLWIELEAWAMRLLRQVDTLARVYGWREGDVLALPPRRRQLYLELATS